MIKLAVLYRALWALFVLVVLLPFGPIMLYGKEAREKIPEGAMDYYFPVFLALSGLLVFVRGCFAFVGRDSEEKDPGSSSWAALMATVHFAVAGLFWFFSGKLCLHFFS